MAGEDWLFGVFGIYTRYRLISSLSVFLESRKMSFSNLLGKSQLSMYVCFGTCIPNSLLTQNFSLKKKLCITWLLSIYRSQFHVTWMRLIHVLNCSITFSSNVHSFIFFFSDYLLSTYVSSGAVMDPGDKQEKKPKKSFFKRNRLTSK